MTQSVHNTTGCRVMDTVVVKSVYRIENFALWQKYSAHLRSLKKKHSESAVTCSDVSPLLGCNLPALHPHRNVLQMKLDLSTDINECLLLHGTTYENADYIVRSGFDFRKGHKGMYGDGLYFASEARKSHQYTCTWCRHKACPCPEERTVIIARVALGDPFYAKSTLPSERRPPERIDGHGLYDSVITNPGKMQCHKSGQQTHQEFVFIWTMRLFDVF